MADPSAIRITDSNLSDGDVLITFSNDTVVLFRAQFLYEMRDHDSNVELDADPPEE